MEADSCKITFSSAPQLPGLTIQPPKRNLLWALDVNKANWGITNGGQTGATPTPPKPGHYFSKTYFSTVLTRIFSLD